MTPNANVPLPLSSLIELAVEHWRLTAWLAAAGGDAAPAAGPARHALRRIGDVLTRVGVEARPLTDHPFTPGLAARVLDTTDDPTLPPGTAVVAETVSPLVLLHGQVVRPADITVRAGPG